VVVDAVAGDLEGARVHQRGVAAAGAGHLAAVAVARGPAVAVDVGYVAGDAVAVEVDVAVADLGLRDHLPHAGAPLGAGGVTGLHAGLARADAQRARRALVAGLRRARLAGALTVLEDVPLAAVRRIAVAVGPPGLALLEDARAVLADVQRVGWIG